MVAGRLGIPAIKLVRHTPRPRPNASTLISLYHPMGEGRGEGSGFIPIVNRHNTKNNNTAFKAWITTFTKCSAPALLPQI